MANAKDVARVFEYLSLHTEGEPIEKTRLNKLMYYAQGHSLSERSIALFDNEIDAWDYGPVVAVVFSNYARIVEQAEEIGLDGIQVTPEEMDTIMDVWEQYKGFTAKQLVDMTHEPDTPWREIYATGIRNAHIPKERIKVYFDRPDHKLTHPTDGITAQPTSGVLPAEEYDADEDEVWEALLNGTE